MAFPDVDWPRVWLDAAGSALSALGGLVIGAWRWGRRSAMKDAQLVARIQEMKGLIDAAEQRVTRLIADQILVRERDFLRKDDFKEWVREEYRADMRDAIARRDP